jgi:phage terminase large subunit
MITLPFQPREYQIPMWAERHAGIKRSIKVWHRRAGKDLDDFNYTLDQMLRRRGNYWHVYPYYAQARKAIWEGKTKEGVSYLDFIPPQLIKARDKQQMSFELINGSIWRLVGADNPDSLVGAGPVGVVYSEYSLQKPSVAEYIRPMILENDGWEAYNFTPRGENHAYHLLEMAKDNPKWFVSVLTIDDTGVITKEQIDEERKQGKSEEIIQQEYYCSFKGSIEGAYFAAEMRKAALENRITDVPHDGAVPVYTFWDLGYNDTTAIWFIQVERGGAFRVIDYYENNGESLAHYSRILEEKRQTLGYDIRPLQFPHDGDSHSVQTGKSPAQVMRDLRWQVDVLPRTNDKLIDIDAARMILNKCWFDKTRCKDGIEALKQYRKEYDENRKVFKSRPLHDWSSNGSDAFMQFAVHGARVVGTVHHKKLNLPSFRPV